VVLIVATDSSQAIAASWSSLSFIHHLAALIFCILLFGWSADKLGPDNNSNSVQVVFFVANYSTLKLCAADDFTCD
jgi:hypothetical protein